MSICSSDGTFDEAGPAARKIREVQRQIAARNRQLQRQQRARSCSIVHKIVQEEWAAFHQERLRAAAMEEGGGLKLKRNCV